jgi:hypothetical protein
MHHYDPPCRKIVKVCVHVRNVGVLFVTIPFMQVGGHAFTRTWQTGVNKSVGIK